MNKTTLRHVGRFLLHPSARTLHPSGVATMKKLTRPEVVSLLACALLAASGVAGLSPARAASSNKKARAQAERVLRSGDFEAAEKMFREIVAKDARDNEARLGLGHALLKQRKNQEAF